MVKGMLDNATSTGSRRRSAVPARHGWFWLVAAMLATGMLCCGQPVHAAQYVVDPNYPRASDENPGTDQAPFYSINRALQNLKAGDTVLIKAGGNPAVLLGYPGQSGNTSSGKSQPSSQPESANRPRSSNTPQPPTWNLRSLLPALVAGAVIVLILVYFLIIQPGRKRRTLLQALQIIAADDRANFQQAEDLLNTALISGLRARDVAEARFALAYVRARLGRFAEASAVLADLIASGNCDRETVYLDLWLHARQKEYEKVEHVYDEHSNLLGDLLQSKYMAGIAFLYQARLLWSRRQVSGALHYFERLKELDVLQDQIPSHIDDHQVMFGIVALFEKDLTEARKHFTGAVEAAKRDGRTTSPGDLGLLLCSWCERDMPDVDAQLGAVLAEMEKRETVIVSCSHCDHSQPVHKKRLGKQVMCVSCEKEFATPPAEGASPSAPGTATESEATAEDDKQLGDEELLMRNVMLWHAVSLIGNWRRLPPADGLPPAEKSGLLSRLDKVRALDPEMGDPRLLAGLICYYFAANEAQREEALKLLEATIGKDIHVPEVLNLVDRERRLDELQRDALKRFLALVGSYVTDRSVPEHYRQQLRERLSRFKRFNDPREIDLEKGEEDAAPSLRDIQTRGTLLHKRVDSIIKGKLRSTEERKVAEAIQGLLEGLEAETKTLVENATRVEETEFELMGQTGEFLLSEEPEDAALEEESESEVQEVAGVAPGGSDEGGQG